MVFPGISETCFTSSEINFLTCTSLSFNHQLHNKFSAFKDTYRHLFLYRCFNYAHGCHLQCFVFLSTIVLSTLCWQEGCALKMTPMDIVKTSAPTTRAWQDNPEDFNFWLSHESLHNLIYSMLSQNIVKTVKYLFLMISLKVIEYMFIFIYISVTIIRKLLLFSTVS